MLVLLTKFTNVVELVIETTFFIVMSILIRKHAYFGGKKELFIGLSNCKIKLCFILKSASPGILNLQQWNRRLCPQLFKYQTVIHIRYHTFLAYCITIKMYMYMKHVKLNWKWNICSSKKTTCTFWTVKSLMLASIEIQYSEMIFCIL